MIWSFFVALPTSSSSLFSGRMQAALNLLGEDKGTSNQTVDQFKLLGISLADELKKAQRKRQAESFPAEAGPPEKKARTSDKYTSKRRQYTKEEKKAYHKAKALNRDTKAQWASDCKVDPPAKKPDGDKKHKKRHSRSKPGKPKK